MKLLCLILVLSLLMGCAPSEPAMASLPTQTTSAPTETTAQTLPPATEPPDPVEELLQTMSTEEKVGQLFLARCPGDSAVSEISTYHPGGFILFSEDFQGETPESIAGTLADYQSASSIPMLIAVDEEGGTVCRVSEHSAFRAALFPSPRSLYEKGGLESVLGTEAEKAYLLSSLGINVNMAPVCDISDTPGAFMYRRSLGQDPHITAEFAIQTTQLMRAFGVGTVWKHFPGYGNNADTHTGIARDNRTLEVLEEWDLIPFSMGILSGCEAILVSHTIVTAMDPENPASLSPAVHDYLRNVMGFQGVIVTDDLVMEAIMQVHEAGEAAVLAVLAGNDLLCSTDYPRQYQAVLAAVQTGRIPLELLDSAVTRILRWKQQLGLIG